MEIVNVPGCCTAALLYSFGEHGEPSLVTVAEIKKMVQRELGYGDPDSLIPVAHKRCIFAISVDPRNIRLLKAAGFRTVDLYEGVQGRVHIMTLHI
jgi:hypothetical protein